MNSKPTAVAAVALLCASLILAADEAPNARVHSIVSPDKQWEYRCNDGLWSSIVKTSTNQMAMDLSNEVEVPYCQSAEVIWAPDSKRFAFNYSPPHAPHTTWETSVFYELRDDKWVLLPSPVDDSARDTFAQLAKYLPKGVRKPRLWNADPDRLVFKVRNWTDDNTAILYVYAASDGARSRKSAFLFTLKFDSEGKWKIVKAQQRSDREIEKEGAEER